MMDRSFAADPIQLAAQPARGAPPGIHWSSTA
jgi:hypothetical protein